MREARALRIACVIVAAAALVANHAVGRLDTPQPRRLPIETFTRRIGQWTAGPDRPIGELFRRYAPTAAAIDRVYTRSDGTGVNLVLVTATDNAGIHDPRVCFPLQGWQLDQSHTRQVRDEQIASMLAIRGADRLRVLFWKTAPTLQRDEGAGRFLRYARGKLVGVQGESLLVRLTTPDGERAEQSLQEFAKDMQPALEPLKRLAQAR
jgi:EpsI family protein